MAIDNQQRQFGGMNFDHLPYSMSNTPHFTNPWASSSTAAQSHAIYAPSHQGLGANLGLDSIAKQQAARTHSNVSMQSYANVPFSPKIC